MKAKKPRIMVGHGEGAFPQKSFEHASKPKHGNISFNAVDIAYKELDPLSRHKHLKLPQNLAMHERMSSPAYLRTKPANSIHHQWSHFSASAMSMGVRRGFFREAFRTLIPGGKLVVIDGAMCEKEFVSELQREGFRVSAKRLTLAELDRLGTDEALNTAGNIRSAKVANIFQNIPKAQFKQMKQSWVAMQLMKEENHSKEVITQLQRMAENMERSLSDRPCVRIVATKPRK